MGARSQFTSSFPDVAVGESANTANHFLYSTCWNLEDALQVDYSASDAIDSNGWKSDIEDDEIVPTTSSWSMFHPSGEIEDQGVLSPSPETGEDQQVTPSSSSYPSEIEHDRNLLPLVQPGCNNFPSDIVGGARSSFSQSGDIAADEFLPSTYSGGWESLPQETEIPSSDWESLNMESAGQDLSSSWSFSQSIEPTGWEWISSDEDDEILPSSISQNSEEIKHHFVSLYYGDIHGAKTEASNRNKWLLLSLQSGEDFITDMLNATLNDEVLAKNIHSKFMLWNVYHNSVEGEKVFCWYKLVSAPAIIVVDPITGRKMHEFSGKIEPENMMEVLLQYMETSPKEELAKPINEAIGISAIKKTFVDDEGSEDVQLSTMSSTAINGEPGSEEEPGMTKSFEKICYPLLPGEPKGENGSLCRVGIRLPDGRRVQRNFLGTDPVVFLWSFCSSLMDEGLDHPFHFTLAAAGVLNKRLDFESSSQTFEEVSLKNSMITLIFD